MQPLQLSNALGVAARVEFLAADGVREVREEGVVLRQAAHKGGSCQRRRLITGGLSLGAHQLRSHARNLEGHLLGVGIEEELDKRLGVILGHNPRLASRCRLRLHLGKAALLLRKGRVRRGWAAGLVPGECGRAQAAERRL